MIYVFVYVNGIRINISAFMRCRATNFRTQIIGITEDVYKIR